ncbi:MAG TPA: hypothetical protein VFZ34_02575 [Blastocatellia bacterium]|nr:hypothetical protein [Blastocatellia bacterium]
MAFDRRSFLASISCSLATAVAAQPQQRLFPLTTNNSCWTEVTAPFIVEDAARGIHTEVVLTSDTFAGVRGHEDKTAATEYEVTLYDADGNAVGDKGIARRMTVPAMQTTVIAARDLLGTQTPFWGGMKIRLRPQNQAVKHASDLFSSAFIRWQTADSFDNVHANPDPLEWQNTTSFFYSMPFPSLAEYDCLFSLFNPYDQPSAGEIVLHDPLGQRVQTLGYELKPHRSLLFHLNAGSFVSDPWTTSNAASKLPTNGLLAVINKDGTAKSFGFLMIRKPAQKRFSVEHPIHQGVFKPKTAPPPFDEHGQFKAKNVLYSPLIFRSKRLGGVTLESRIFLGTGLPLEEALWLYPFAVDTKGEVVWSAMTDDKLKAALPASQCERKIIRLAAGQSCALDFAKLSLPAGFSGGLAVAVTPDTTHTLLKVEVRVPEWGAHAFTHFRPGLRSARNYQKPKERGGLATDYIAAGARIERGKFDEIIGVINIDDQGVAGNPTLEIFNVRGLLMRIKLGALPPFACQHFLLSELVKKKLGAETLSLRLVDEQATLLMSTLHLDYTRRDLALDHGSDRFSTFLDYGCS